MPFALRTRIKRDIVAEFVPPKSPRRRGSNRVIILCGGMPGYPSKTSLMFFLSGKGYWVFSPRYRGSWESGGTFLRRSPHEDVIDLIDTLPVGFLALGSGKKYKISKPEVYLVGSSFGGPAVILASTDKRVRKAVAFSPVTDWSKETKSEPLDWMEKFTRAAFGNGYRFEQKDWNKLKNGTFYNPIAAVRKLDKDKIYIIHAKDDEVVYASSSIAFAKKLGCKITLLNKGGHLSASNLMKAAFWKRVSDFFRSAPRRRRRARRC